MKVINQRSLLCTTIPVLMFFAFFSCSEILAQIRLERNDIILSINGRTISNTGDYSHAVNRSSSKMSFTIIDSNSGKRMNLTTQLASRGQRFGVTARDNGGYGVRVIDVVPGSAAQYCYSGSQFNSGTNYPQDPPGVVPGSAPRQQQYRAPAPRRVYNNRR